MKFSYLIWLSYYTFQVRNAYPTILAGRSVFYGTSSGGASGGGVLSPLQEEELTPIPTPPPPRSSYEVLDNQNLDLDLLDC